MYKFFSPESFIKKKKKNSLSKFYHTSIVQFLLFLPQKSELTYSKQFRCQPQSSIISTTDWQWRSPNVHKLSTPFFSRRDRVLYFISQYFISWPSHEVSSSSSSDSAGGTGNWLLCSTAQEFRRALILNSLHFWPEANQEKKKGKQLLSSKDKNQQWNDVPEDKIVDNGDTRWISKFSQRFPPYKFSLPRLDVSTIEIFLSWKD